MERHLRLVPPPLRSRQAEFEGEMARRVRVSYGGGWRKYTDPVPEGWMPFGTVTLPGEKPAALFMSASGTGLRNKTLHATVELSEWAQCWARYECDKEIAKAEWGRRKTPLPIVRELRQKAKRMRRDQEEVDSGLYAGALQHTQQIAFDEVGLISLIDLMNPKTLWCFLEHLGPFAGRNARVVAAIEDRIEGYGGGIASATHTVSRPNPNFIVNP